MTLRQQHHGEADRNGRQSADNEPLDAVADALPGGVAAHLLAVESEAHALNGNRGEEAA